MKPHISAIQLKKMKETAIDEIDRLLGEGRYANQPGNFCYGDGLYAKSLETKYGTNLSNIKKWATS